VQNLLAARGLNTYLGCRIEKYKVVEVLLKSGTEPNINTSSYLEQIIFRRY